MAVVGGGAQVPGHRDLPAGLLRGRGQPKGANARVKVTGAEGLLECHVILQI